MWCVRQQCQTFPIASVQSVRRWGNADASSFKTRGLFSHSASGAVQATSDVLHGFVSCSRCSHLREREREREREQAPKWLLISYLVFFHFLQCFFNVCLFLLLLLLLKRSINLCVADVVGGGNAAEGLFSIPTHAR